MLQRSNELGIVEQEGLADRGDGPAHARVAILIFRSLRLRGAARVCRRERARARHGVNQLSYSGCERLAIEGPPLRRVRGRSLGAGAAGI